MNAWLPWNRVSLTERDREVLAEVEDAVDGRGAASEGAAEGVRAFSARLAQAAPLRPAEGFAMALEARLLAVAAEANRAAGWPAIRLGRRVALVTVVASALALGTSAAVGIGVPLPAFLDSHGKRVAPQVVTTPPVLSGPSVAITPPDQWIDPLELSKQLGLPVYVPNYLPSGCPPIRSWASLPPAPHVGHLQYACIGIQVFALDVHIRPAVAPGSVEDLAVGGRPATLIKGSWSTGSDGETIWYEGTMQLFVEHPGVTVGVQSSAGTLTREELLRIAESLQAISAK